jgi:hypothetical protein
MAVCILSFALVAYVRAISAPTLVLITVIVIPKLVGRSRIALENCFLQLYERRRNLLFRKNEEKISFWHVFCFHRKRRPNWTPYPEVIVPFTEAMLALIA